MVDVSAGEFHRWWRNTCVECPTKPKLEDFAAMKSWSSVGTTDTMASVGLGAGGSARPTSRCSTPGLYGGQAEMVFKAMTFYQDVCRHVAVLSAVEEVKSHAKILINQLQGTVTRYSNTIENWREIMQCLPQTTDTNLCQKTSELGQGNTLIC